jgi:hypothetical protein
MTGWLGPRFAGRFFVGGCGNPSQSVTYTTGWRSLNHTKETFMSENTRDTLASSAHNAPSTTPTLAPDFRHRLSVLGDEANAENVTDAIQNLSEQAESLLAIIQDQFIHGTTFSNQVIHSSLEAVKGLVADINAISQAYQTITQQSAEGGKAGV